MIVGIDPGRAGGYAAITLEQVSVSVLPATYLFADTIDSLIAIGLKHVFVEKAQCMPKNGAVGMFNYGQGFGELLGVLIALKVPFTLVPPRAWSKVMHAGVQGDDPKKKSITAAKRLFPNVELRATERCRKPHLGMVEALLIAEYGRRQLRA